MSVKSIGMMLFMHSDAERVETQAEEQSGWAVGGGFPDSIKPTWDTNG